jgi:hypothetical protein
LFDESVYANTGRLLAQGRLTPFSRNPLVGGVYALTYLPFSGSDFWLVGSLSVGRVVMFTLMWWAAYLVFKQIKTGVPALVMAGLLFTSPVLVNIVRNQSDSLFAAFSGFALWQMLAYFNHRRIRNLALTSLILGFAALARNDGLVLFVIFLGLAVWLSWKQDQLWRRVAAAVIPFIAIAGGYFLGYGLATGDFDQGLSSRTYIAFLQGQASTYTAEDCVISEIQCGVLGAEEVYGTAEENDYSVFKAIRNNPAAYWLRLKASFRSIPNFIYLGYGKLNIVFLAALAGWGVVELVRRKQVGLLVLILAWMAYLGVYFLTFFRRGYLQMVYFGVYTLMGVGAYALASRIKDRRERLGWTAFLVLLLVGGMIAGNQTIILSAVLLLAAVWLAWLRGGQDEGGRTALVFLSLLLAIGIMLNVGINPYVPHEVGSLPEEEAVLVIKDALPSDSLVAAGAPGWVWNSGMDYVSLGESVFNVDSGEELYDLLWERGVDAVYIDPYVSNAAAKIWAMIEPEIGHHYEEIYSGREGSIRVLLLNP